MSALAFTHLDQIGERGAERAIDRGPCFFCAHWSFRKTQHAWRLENCADRDLARRVEFFLKGAHRFVIRAGQIGIERKVARTVLAVVKSHDDIGSAARNIFVDRLANAWLELREIAWQTQHD